MLNRITENKKTSFVGALIFVIGVTLVFFDKASLAELGGFLGVSFALLFSKDPKTTK